MSITKDYKKLKEQELKLRNMQSESLESKIEAILPYVIQNGADNFKNSSLETLYDDVLTHMNSKNNIQGKETQDTVLKIIAEAQQNREHFIFGEGDYTNLSIEERMKLFSDKHGAFLLEIGDEPLYRMAYEIPQDEVLNMFHPQDNISREDFNNFKNLYKQIKEKNIEFINKNQNRESSESGLNILKAYALEIELMIRKSNVSYGYIRYLNDLLSKRTEYNSTFIPFQKDQIAGKNVQNKTETDLIHSFVRELNADFNFKGQENFRNNYLLKVWGENINLLEGIKPGFKKLLKNSQEVYNHKQLNSELKPILNEFYTPVLNVLNAHEVSCIYAASTIVQRFYSNFLPKENFIMNENTGEFSYHKPVKEDHPFSRIDNSEYFSNKKDTFYTSSDVIYSKSNNLRWFNDFISEQKNFPEKTIVPILDNMHQSISSNSLKIGDFDMYVENFSSFGKIREDIKKGFSSSPIRIPSSLQDFLLMEFDNITNINAKHYNVRPNITIESSLNIPVEENEKENGNDHKPEQISSLSVIKRKFSSLFGDKDAQNNNENKYKK